MFYKVFIFCAVLVVSISQIFASEIGESTEGMQGTFTATIVQPIETTDKLSEFQIFYPSGPRHQDLEWLKGKTVLDFENSEEGLSAMRSAMVVLLWPKSLLLHYTPFAQNQYQGLFDQMYQSYLDWDFEKLRGQINGLLTLKEPF